MAPSPFSHYYGVTFTKSPDLTIPHSTNKLYRRITLCLRNNTMSTRIRMNLVIAGFLLRIGLICSVAPADSLAQVYKTPIFGNHEFIVPF